MRFLFAKTIESNFPRGKRCAPALPGDGLTPAIDVVAGNGLGWVIVLIGKRAKFPNADALTVVPAVESWVDCLLSAIVAGVGLAIDIVAISGVPPVGRSDVAVEVVVPENIDITEAPSGTDIDDEGRRSRYMGWKILELETVGSCAGLRLGSGGVGIDPIGKTSVDAADDDER